MIGMTIALLRSKDDLYVFMAKEYSDNPEWFILELNSMKIDEQLFIQKTALPEAKKILLELKETGNNEKFLDTMENFLEEQKKVFYNIYTLPRVIEYVQKLKSSLVGEASVRTAQTATTVMRTTMSSETAARASTAEGPK